METFCSWIIVLFIIGIILYNIIENYKYNNPKKTKTENPPNIYYNSSTSSSSSSSTQPVSIRPSSPVSRPTSSSYPPSKPVIAPPKPPSRPVIQFRPVIEPTITSDPKFEDLQDALTGEKLDAKRGLYQCNQCKVFYHSENYAILKDINSSKCVACQSTDIRPATQTSQTSRSSAFTPNVITLENYKNFVGQVVTFEGFVYTIRESERYPGNFAVMFEDKSWTRGFKLVFLKNATYRMGGDSFVYSLANKKVRVRGLIVKDDIFGYEIVVTEKQMILGVF